MNRKHKSAASHSHEEARVESFRNDPAFAADYLNAILKEGNQDELMLASRRMSEAFLADAEARAEREIEREYALPHAFVQSQSGLKELAGGSTGHGNAAHRPSTAKRVA